MKKRSRWLLAALAVFAVASASFAEVYVDGSSGTNVDGCGSSSSPCQTINFGIEQAQDGDTVRVLPGSYNECVTTSGKRVALLADAFDMSGNRTATVIDGEGQCDGALGVLLPTVFLGDGSSLRGFTVRGGGDSGVRAFGSIQITQNVITGNLAEVGGGVLAYGTDFYSSTAELKIEDNLITTNSANAGGGGVYVLSQGLSGAGLRPVRVANNTIRDNRTLAVRARGAGVFVLTERAPGERTSVVITRNTIEGNQYLGPANEYYSGYGGGIWAASGRYSYVTSTYGNGIDTIQITDNTILKNRSGGRGGGMALYTYTNSGGEAEILAANNVVESNLSIDPVPTKPAYGGGIWSWMYGYGFETIRVEDNFIRSNTATTNGGGVSAWLFISSGTSSQTLAVEGNTIERNRAEAGGGLDLLNFPFSGLPSTTSGSLLAANNWILNNTAAGYYAGGIFATVLSNATNASGVNTTIHGNEIRNNVANLGGGGAVLQVMADERDDPDNPDSTTAPSSASLLFDNNLVRGNQAVDPVDPIGVGGGVLVYLEAVGDATATANMEFNTFFENEADYGAGGIEIETNAAINGANTGTPALKIDSSIITDNTGYGVGGPGPGVPGLFSPGGEPIFQIEVSYNDTYGNLSGNWEPWLQNPTGTSGNIDSDPLLSASAVPQRCSPSVDAADPDASWSQEPPPNGRRANMGHLGRTALATQSLPDLNADRLVDGVEVLQIAHSFGAKFGEPRYYAPADIDGKCSVYPDPPAPQLACVDGDDLHWVATQFGSKCP